MASRRRRLIVVLTIRTEFLPALQRALPPEVRVEDRSLGPVTRLAEVIEQPAARFGIELGPGLARDMVTDTRGADALPLLAYTLRELCERFGDDKLLTSGEYRALGGVRGAIETKLKEALSDVRPDELAALRRAFVRPTEQAELAAEAQKDAERQAEVAKEQRDEAFRNDSLFRTEQAQSALDEGLLVTTMQLALAGLPENPAAEDARPWLPEPASALVEAMGQQRELLLLAAGRVGSYTAGFSSDGGRIVSASSRSVRVWNASSGELLLILEGHEDRVRAAEFSPDGGQIVSGSEDGTVRVTWVGRDKLELVETARARLPRQLTEDEKRRYYVTAE